MKRYAEKIALLFIRITDFILVAINLTLWGPILISHYFHTDSFRNEMGSQILVEVLKELVPLRPLSAFQYVS